ncbi:MAG TPA: Maf family protein [Rudaea sp.]|nr:Maf family protein [Rudaea sp.]
MIALTDIELVLASTSRYRRELLQRIAPRFRTVAPEVDETAHDGEPAATLATRLASAKALAVAAACPGALVIGSDQVAECDGVRLGKPGDAEHARAQLSACSGRSVTFHTGVCLCNTRRQPTKEYTAIDTTRVVFRQLDAAEIARYVQRESPLDCAGSFKCEALGIGLFERIESTDPTALIGLPLIALCRMLREAGISPI